MADGVGAFNKAASDEYKSLNKAEKEQLLELAGKTAEDKPMKVKDIKRAGAKAFKKIQNQVIILLHFLTSIVVVYYYCTLDYI